MNWSRGRRPSTRATPGGTTSDMADRLKGLSDEELIADAVMWQARGAADMAAWLRRERRKAAAWYAAGVILGAVVVWVRNSG
jgi:hypothetical protein